MVNQTSLAAYGLTNINEVVAATNSLEAFITYGSNATTPPAGGALLPVYKPSTTAGALGTLSSVTLSGNALAPVAGIFSPDNTIFFAGTSGDNQLHLIDTTTLLDTTADQPQADGYQWQTVAAGIPGSQAETDYLIGVGVGLVTQKEKSQTA